MYRRSTNSLYRSLISILSNPEIPIVSGRRSCKIEHRLFIDDFNVNGFQFKSKELTDEFNDRFINNNVINNNIINCHEYNNIMERIRMQHHFERDTGRVYQASMGTIRTNAGDISVIKYGYDIYIQTNSYAYSTDVLNDVPYHLTSWMTISNMIQELSESGIQLGLNKMGYFVLNQIHIDEDDLRLLKEIL